MLCFERQEKILAELLRRKSNSNCADCTTISPTWASLDFGVFLCSNCSGAHRSLGPTVTRVKSTKLDKWHQDWVACMQVGNNQLNQYWEAQLNPANPTAKKPTSVASLEEVKRYVIEKYMRKRLVPKGREKDDPKTFHKNGNTIYQQNQSEVEKKNKNVQSQSKEAITTAPISNTAQKQTQLKTDLLFFEQKIEPKSLNWAHPNVGSVPVADEDDEFGHYTQGSHETVSCSLDTNSKPAQMMHAAQKSLAGVSFEEMIKANQEISKLQQQKRQMQINMNMQYNLNYNSCQLNSMNNLSVISNHGQNPIYPYQNPLHVHNYLQPRPHKINSLGTPLQIFAHEQIHPYVYQNISTNLPIQQNNFHSFNLGISNKEEDGWSNWQ